LPNGKTYSLAYANPVGESLKCSEEQSLGEQQDFCIEPICQKTLKDYRLDGTVLSKLPNDGTNKIAITIDDCYNLDVLKGILDAFVEHNQVMQSVIPDYKASMTLFPVGELIKIEKYLELFKRAKKEGHDIANHTLTHKNLTAVSDEVIKEEITETNKLLKEKLGVDCYILRAPYGAIDVNLIEIAIENQIKDIIQWSKYARDAQF
jgi:peptidoglycan/xylan/chitin deacetylase (PgdA/CDA1 family)